MELRKLSVTHYFILIQNLFLLIFVITPAWLGCTGKKKGSAKSKMGGVSEKSSGIKSAIKPPLSDPGQQSQAVQAVKEEKKEDGPKEQKETSKKEEKEGEKNEEPNKNGDPGKTSQKKFPTFVMPTESIKKKKEKANEEDKHKKITEGFYQAKSDEDDTLEKIESLAVEKSDKTKRSKRSQKNKKK